MKVKQKYAGFWIRLVAGIIDIVFICIPLFFIVGISASSYFYDYYMGLTIFFLGSPFIYSATKTIFLISKWQGTLGMKFLSIKIVNKKLEKISFIRAFIREILISFVVLFSIIFISLSSFPPIQAIQANRQITIPQEINEEYGEKAIYFINVDYGIEERYREYFMKNMPKFSSELETTPYDLKYTYFYENKDHVFRLKNLYQKKAFILMELWDEEFNKLSETKLTNLKKITRNYHAERQDFMKKLSPLNKKKKVRKYNMKYLFFLLLYLFPIAITSKKTAIHDILCGTRVVYKNKSLIINQ